MDMYTCSHVHLQAWTAIESNINGKAKKYHRLMTGISRESDYESHLEIHAVQWNLIVNKYIN